LLCFAKDFIRLAMDLQWAVMELQGATMFFNELQCIVIHGIIGKIPCPKIIFF
jgi:hypothetical protein